MYINKVLTLLLAFSLVEQGCGQSPNGPTTTPTPTATPTPAPTPNPVGVPNSTALRNLPLVSSLEKANGRPTVLVEISGRASSTTGALPDGEAWGYTFGEQAATGVALYYWRAHASGKIEYAGPVPDVSHAYIFDMAKVLKIDSSDAVALALGQGGREYVVRFPDSVAFMQAVVTDTAVWKVTFVDQSRNAPCDLLFLIDGNTGRVGYRDTDCLSRLH